MQITDPQDFQNQTGFRPIFTHLPSTRSMSQRAVIPMGIFYSPFLAQPKQLKKGIIPTCIKCKACICPQAQKDRNTNKWLCPFCQTHNSYQQEFGIKKIQQVYQTKTGDCGMFFIIDLCVLNDEMESIKDTLIKTIKKLPKQLYVGMIIFNNNVMLANLQNPSIQYLCFNGLENYQSTQQILEILEIPHNKGAVLPKTFINKFYAPLKNNIDKIIQAIQQLSADSHTILKGNRQKRATGAALQIAINTICSLAINTRFVTLIGGPCTIGPGKVVDLPLKNTIRVYLDILQNNQNTQYLKSATKFYQALAKIIIDNKCTMDIWAYGTDQFGLLEMREMVNQSGGLMAMHEQFNYFIFQKSFQRFYQPNQHGILNFPFACNLRIRLTKQLKINGILGTCKSTKQNSNKFAAQMQIGEGKTSQWYLGGIDNTNSLCIMFSHSQIANSQNKQKGCLIQCITTYKFNDNVIRTKVATINLSFLRQVQFKQLIRGFDEVSATVMLARMASRKAQIQDITEVKKWLDRILLKFCLKFSQFQPRNPQSFHMPNPMKHFPQFMYHLRRSSLINSFGGPPDQSIYMKTCLQRQSLPNCTVMIQSALFKYSTDVVDQQGNIQPQSVQLDLQQMKDDAVLLLDSYFNVIVWYGKHVQGWKQQKLYEDPQYQYLANLFKSPMNDASQIMYDRIPISNYYQTSKDDPKQRYLKARVNPSNSNSIQKDGNFVSDDAPINIFMDFLVKSIVNHIQ